MFKRRKNWTSEDWAKYYEKKDREAVPAWAWYITWGFMIAELIVDCFR